MNRPIDTDALATSLERAEGILNAVIDQAYLNGPDAVKPAALQAALAAVMDAMQHARPGPVAAPVTAVAPVPAIDRDRFRRAVSLLQVLLDKTEADDSGIQVCDTLETAIVELQAVGGLES